jgi:hypothetical protein
MLLRRRILWIGAQHSGGRSSEEIMIGIVEIINVMRYPYVSLSTRRGIYNFCF